MNKVRTVNDVNIVSLELVLKIKNSTKYVIEEIYLFKNYIKLTSQVVSRNCISKKYSNVNIYVQIPCHDVCP